MGKIHKPVAGSRGYWPKKRARRIYPDIVTYRYAKALPAGFAAYKAGMAGVVISGKGQHEGEGAVQAATILEAPPLDVIGIACYRKSEGRMETAKTIFAPKLPQHLARKGFFKATPDNEKTISDTESKITPLDDIRLVVSTRPSDIGLKKTPEVFELPVGGRAEEKWQFAKGVLGKQIYAKDVFEENELVDTIAVTTGKGYQGVVKRFGVKIRSRKSKKKRRHLGTLGPWHPARVLPGRIAMAGQLGFQRRTELNKLVLKIGDGGVKIPGGIPHYGEVKGNYMLIKGSVPGHKKRLILLRKAIRPHALKSKTELKKVILRSQN